MMNTVGRTIFLFGILNPKNFFNFSELNQDEFLN
jgi:hypothetical protein